MLIRKATAKDALAISKIYNYYIKNTVITFETKVVQPAEIGRRMKSGSPVKHPWIVGVVDGRVVGYAYSDKFQERDAYRRSVELTVYLDNTLRGHGYGKALYGHLISMLKKTDIAVMIGGIALPNEASVKLHEYFGFKNVAHFKKVGFKLKKWIDVGYWEKIV